MAHRRTTPCAPRIARAFACIAAVLLAATPLRAQPAPPVTPAYTLAELVALAQRESPLLAVGRGDVDVARAAILTARMRPNPEIEITPGWQRARGAGVDAGASPAISVAQPIENPSLREARLRAAQSRVDVAQAQSAGLALGLVAAVRQQYHAFVRLKEELVAFGEDLQLTEQIRDRVAVRVRTGEAPRFDLYRADSEVAIARKNVETTRLRVRQAGAELRRLVGPGLPEAYDVVAPSADLPPPEELAPLRAGLAVANPDIAIAARELARAERQVAVERNAVLPQVTLRAVHERDPLVSTVRVGASLTVPIVNRREGPIAEARAQAERSRLAVTLREFETLSAFDAALEAYRAATAQVRALEGGVLQQARTVVEIAEAAYRLGERGILEYLDAQRQFRLVRNELIQARYAQHSARIELERLAGR